MTSQLLYAIAAGALGTALAGAQAASQDIARVIARRIMIVFGRQAEMEEREVDLSISERLTQPELGERAMRVAALLQESESLLDELTTEMQARAATLEQLKADAEHAQRIAEIHKDQQEAVAMLLRLELEKQEEQLRKELDKQSRRSFWQGLFVNLAVGLLFFVAGALLTAALT